MDHWKGIKLMSTELYGGRWRDASNVKCSGCSSRESTMLCSSITTWWLLTFLYFSSNESNAFLELSQAPDTKVFHRHADIKPKPIKVSIYSESGSDGTSL